MTDFLRFLRSLSRRQQWALGTGVLVILAAASVLGFRVLREPYGVLFSDVAEQDAAAIVQELDKLKVPYQIGAQGQALMVPEAVVHKTRMALMGRPLPLQGAVGFELFNQADFGASDFVQKVNYQRALQGELTRTIASLEQVRSVRVHLVLPEQGLFRKEASRHKASVTVVTQPGQPLAGNQVLGIQRLVAASVPEVRVDDVTVLDQHGVTLSRASGDGGLPGSTALVSHQLESKRELEEHLTRKATQVLDRVFGAGTATVSVDVLLSHQHTRTTTEEVLPAAQLPKNQLPTGVVVRERSSSRDGTDAGKPAAGLSTQEIDYATGKRVEHTVLPGGHVLRLHAAAVVKGGLAETELARVRDLVATSVGAQPSRGDVVAVYAVAAVPQDWSSGANSDRAPVAAPAPRASGAESRAPASSPEPATVLVPIILAGLLLMAILTASVMAWRRRRSLRKDSQPEPIPLTPAQREVLLQSVQRWLQGLERHHGA